MGESRYYSDPICLCSIWLQSEQVRLDYLIYRFASSVWLNQTKTRHEKSPGNCFTTAVVRVSAMR